MSEVSPIVLRRRSIPQRLRYLADRLSRAPERDAEAVFLALEVMADELYSAMGGPEVTAVAEEPGRLVREVWVTWAGEQLGAKPSWLVGWEELDDGQREVDARIEAAVRADERERCIAEIFAYADQYLAPVIGAAYRDAARLLLRGR